jgi:hypothetical protein
MLARITLAYIEMSGVRCQVSGKINIEAEA